MKRALTLLLAAVQFLGAEPRVPRPGVQGVQTGITDLKPSGTFQLGGNPDWMAITHDAVWISNARRNAIQRIDPETNKIVKEIVFSAPPCSGLTAAFGSLWVPLCSNPASLARVNLATYEITIVLPIGPADSEGGITASSDSIWIVADNDGTLARIDPKTNSIASKVKIPTGSFNPVFSEGLVWITANTTNQLIVVDPQSNSVVASIGVGPKPRFLTAGAGSIWTLNQGDGSVTRANVKQRRVTSTIQAGVPGEGGEICFGAGSIWATVFDIPLTRISVKTNKVLHQWTGEGGDSVCFGHNSIWLTDFRKGLLFRIPLTQF
jgi:virginiamycin B lyase